MKKPFTKCDLCGGSLEDGYEEREYDRDPETGYSDYEVVCGKCAYFPEEIQPVRGGASTTSPSALKGPSSSNAAPSSREVA